MNKRQLLLGSMVVLALLVIGSIVIAAQWPKTAKAPGTTQIRSSSNPRTFTSASPYATSDACKLLTLDEAKQVLGSNATNLARDPLDTEHRKISRCNYSTYDPSRDRSKTAVLEVSWAKTAEGARVNAGAFEAQQLPLGASKVKGYGSSAYWEPTSKTLFVLNENDVFSISSGTLVNDSGKLEAAKLVADQIFEQ